MSQHDMDVANQGSAAFRADLNLALQALVSNSSGSSEPATTFAYQLWYDTTTNILKQRNSANDAWISLMTLDQGNDQVDTLYVRTLIDALVDNTADIGHSSRAFKDIYMQGDLYFDNDNSRTQDHYTWVPLIVANPSGAASVDFDVSSYAAYDTFKVVFDSLVPSSTGSDLLMRVSTDGGSSWDSAASDYYGCTEIVFSASQSQFGGIQGSGLTSIQLTDSCRNNTGGYFGEITVYNLAAVGYTFVIGGFVNVDASGTPQVRRTSCGWLRNVVQSENAFQFFMGNCIWAHKHLRERLCIRL